MVKLGFIDSYLDGIASGWLFVEGVIEPTFDIVDCNSGKAFQGKANIYRRDIEEAGYNDGLCGFQVDVGTLGSTEISLNYKGEEINRYIISNKEININEAVKNNNGSSLKELLKGEHRDRVFNAIDQLARNNSMLAIYDFLNGNECEDCLNITKEILGPYKDLFISRDESSLQYLNSQEIVEAYVYFILWGECILTNENFKYVALKYDLPILIEDDSQCLSFSKMIPSLARYEDRGCLSKLINLAISLHETSGRSFSAPCEKLIDYIKRCVISKVFSDEVRKNYHLINDFLDLCSNNYSFLYDKILCLKVDIACFCGEKINPKELNYYLNLDHDYLSWNTLSLITLYEKYRLEENQVKVVFDVIKYKFNIGKIKKEEILLLGEQASDNINFKVWDVKFSEIESIVCELCKYIGDKDVDRVLKRIACNYFDEHNSVVSLIDNAIWVAGKERKLSHREEKVKKVCSNMMRNYFDSKTKNSNSALKVDKIHIKLECNDKEYQKYISTLFKNESIDVCFYSGCERVDVDGIKLELYDSTFITPSFVNNMDSLINSEIYSSNGVKLGSFYEENSALTLSINKVSDSIVESNHESILTDVYGLLHVPNQKTFNKYIEYYSFLIESKIDYTIYSQGKDTLFGLKVDENKLYEDKFVAFIVQRNEKERLDNCFNYYKELGVEHFVVIDNNSDDGTLSYLLEHDDVSLFSAPQRYSKSRYGVDWIDLIIRQYRNNKWCLVIDPDEELHLEGFDNLTVISQVMESTGCDALYVPFIDVYSKSPMKVHSHKFKDISHDDIYFDSRWYTSTHSYSGFSTFQPVFQGGVRGRLFNLDNVVLNKVPLFKFNAHMGLKEGVHWIDNANVFYSKSLLLHHKYNHLFHEYVEIESRRGEHWNGGVEYKKYARLIKENPELTLFDEHFSQPIKKFYE
ncbi:glycosyltransferase family 2 protein [Vibrio parahaemolyticus]|uniref:Glycosyltransferase family 2 protein n=4 Tax=Vibrio parahaemolyticus TaxID=670 RepID=A0AA46UIT9_VIBPH|nr:glycosyltransferase family 2 protein [Vibrio parahaemolyticus]MCC3850205.1 glycosyltransferase family 2 protein [Vibrio parahaemolyticus]UYV26219.1 glycosyltransferase family 2 protein [Vibrio parahaemolyticus]HCJ4876862.1 glycosyltransferase family 2 protein [Vibrio parahaemolyticus]